MGDSYMEWDKNNIDEIVGFINRELETGRPMNNIELEEFGVNERVIHKRLLRIGYKKQIISITWKIVLQVILPIIRRKLIKLISK